VVNQPHEIEQSGQERDGEQNNWIVKFSRQPVYKEESEKDWHVPQLAVDDEHFVDVVHDVAKLGRNSQLFKKS
jgi:hypothetical protein